MVGVDPTDTAKQPDNDAHNQYQAENAPEAGRTVAIIAVVTTSAAQQQNQQDNNNNRAHGTSLSFRTICWSIS